MRRVIQSNKLSYVGAAGEGELRLWESQVGNAGSARDKQSRACAERERKIECGKEREEFRLSIS